MKILIYIIGFVVTYLIGRYTGRKILKTYDWTFVILNVFISLFSFFGAIAFLMILFFEVISEADFKNPPKWL